ncbi:hypothetical protein ACFPPD_13745 [Cohnella suwonensis]|uniref:Pre-toxin TG domain-containing protein n=1 Tax=Cohnella suwonensis TaxID=696072 RepID=A0ABW0LY30_9BACL
MPKHAELRKELEESRKSKGQPEAAGEVSDTAQSGQASDKKSIMKRLKAQGAVNVFPFLGGGSEEEESPESESAEQTVEEPKTTTEAANTSPSPESESSETESAETGSGQVDSSFHDRVKKMTDAANDPKWYDLPQHIENARYGKWDLSQQRERSGGRARDASMEEDVRTNKIENQMNPGLFDVEQRAKNAINDVTSNPGQTAAGMIPVIGKGIKQKMAEKYDVKERDLLKGISATTTSDSIRESTASQAGAVGAKISNDRFKAGVGMVTGVVGDLVPGAGKIGSAVGAAAGMVADQVNKKEIGQVRSSRARAQARKDMGKAEFGEYENVDDFMNMEKQRKELVAAGKGGPAASAAAPVVDSAEQVQRLTAHARGETAHHKFYKQRAKEVEKERAAAAKPKEEGAGMLSRIKNFFGR